MTFSLLIILPSYKAVFMNHYEGYCCCVSDFQANMDALPREGGHYRLRALAKDSETCETMVVYEALYGDGGLWVRPAKMFFETVTRDGQTFPRFRLV